MAISNTIIQIKKSTVSGNAPSSLANGEIAINTADGKFFYRTPSGGIGSISQTSSFATVNANSSLILATSSTDTLSINSGNNIVVAANTTAKSISIALANTVTIANSLTIGGGTGGSITGASSISANTFIANSLVGALPLSVNITAGAGNQNTAILVTGANTKGGVGYVDFLQANNLSGSTTNGSKWFRLDSNGQYQIINSAYTQNIFNLNDSGYLTIPGSFTFGSSGTNYIQFGDGTKQYTANAGGSSTDTIARTSAQAAFDEANAAYSLASSASSTASSASSTASAAYTTACNATVLAQAAYNQANTGGGGGPYIITGANYVDYGWVYQSAGPVQFNYGTL